MRRRYCNPHKPPPETLKGTPYTSITSQQLPAYPYQATPTSSTSLTHPAPSSAPPRSSVPPCASPGAQTASTRSTTGATIFRASSHGELSTPADAVTATPRPTPIQLRNILVVVDATADIHLTKRLADPPLHRALKSGLTTQALGLWMAFRGMHPQDALQIVNQEPHPYTYGNGRTDTHAKHQNTNPTPELENVRLDAPHQSHLQHLPPIPSATHPPHWIPEDKLYRDRHK